MVNTGGFCYFKGVKMSEIVDRFSLKFEGAATLEHQIDVSTFAKTLIALNELTSKSVEAVNGNNAVLKVSSEIRAGSVITDFVLTHQALIEASGGAFSAISSLIELLRVVKFLKGQEPKECISDDDGKSVKIGNIEGQYQTFNSCVFNMYQSPGIRGSLANMTCSLDNEGIEQITLSPRGVTGERITKEDRPSFKKLQSKELLNTVQQCNKSFYVLKMDATRKDCLKITVVSEDHTLRGNLQAFRVPKDDLFVDDCEQGLKDDEVNAIVKAMLDRTLLQLNTKLEINEKGVLSGGEIFGVVR